MTVERVTEEKTKAPIHGIDKEALRRERTIITAQTLSFRTMADSLLHDISGESLPPRTRVITLSAKKAPPPLAKVVAEEYLERLGLASKITLELADKEEIEARLNPDLKPPLTQDQIEARRAVTGYRWKRGIRLDDPTKTQIKGVLLKCQKEAERARDELITDYVNLVKAVALRYKDKGIPLDELIAEGNLDLVRLVGRFDWRRGFSLFAFLDTSLDGRMKKVFRDNGEVIRKPRPVNDNKKSVLNAYGNLIQELGHEPSIAAIVEKTGLDKSLVEEILSPKSGRVVSLNISVGGAQSHSEITGLELLQGDQDTEGRAVNSVIIEAILARLTDRDREIFIRSILGQTQSEIGRAVGVSQMHVSRLLNAIRGMIAADLYGYDSRTLQPEPVESKTRRTPKNPIQRLSSEGLTALFSSFPHLIERDQEIIRMLHAGQTPVAIASALNISEKTVGMIKVHVLALIEEFNKQSENV